MIGDRDNFTENLGFLEKSFVEKFHPDLFYLLNSYQEVICFFVLCSYSGAHMYSDHQPSLGYINYCRIQRKQGKVTLSCILCSSHSHGAAETSGLCDL